MVIYVDPDEIPIEGEEKPEGGEKKRKPRKKSTKKKKPVKKRRDTPPQKKKELRKPKKKTDPDMPKGFDYQCTARTKTCSSCQHRYKKGDKTWVCPNCGMNRRCQNKAITDRPTCRMHGGGGGRPPGAKYVIAKRISETFNRVFADPTIWDMAENQATLGARFEQLILQLDEITEEEGGGVDASAIHILVSKARKAIYKEQENLALDCLEDIMEILAPANREQYLWRQIMEINEMLRRNADSHKRYLLQQESKVSINEVVEVLVLIQKLAFIFIPEPRDRKAFARKMREFLPHNRDLAEGELPN